MSGSILGRALVLLGILSLCHTAYSAVQHRRYVRIKEIEFTTLPGDIIIQGIFSLAVTMIGVMFISGNFMEIRISKGIEDKSWETFRNVTSFYTFNHRGKALSPDYDPDIAPF